ncbi:MAG: hypothetical protein ACRD4D_08640 [Candidatus Acidiferrales bacterium]
MRNGKQLYWLTVAVLGLALLLPAGLAAQETDEGSASGEEAASGPADRQERHREFHERARERFENLRGQTQADREAYRQAVEEFGKDSSQAREARRALQRDNRLFQRSRQTFTDRHQRLHRRGRGR